MSTGRRRHFVHRFKIIIFFFTDYYGKSFFLVNEMEKCRNDYRGALLWMKNVSQELDPDTFKQLEKFRRVQNHVRASKAKFDRHKLACLQKIDLLAAARCNMFSHGLIVYQDNMAAFWQRTSSALSTVSEAYQGDFPILFL